MKTSKTVDIAVFPNKPVVMSVAGGTNLVGHGVRREKDRNIKKRRGGNSQWMACRVECNRCTG